MKGIGDRIKQRREFLGFSQAALGKMVGVDQSTVALWETGKTTPRPDKVQALARPLDVSPEYLLVGELGDTGVVISHSVPIVGYITSNDEVKYFPEKAVHYIVAPPPSEPQVEEIGGALVVRGDVLWPTYATGDLLFFASRRRRPEEAIGLESLVALTGGETVLKRVGVGRTARKWTLSSSRTPDMIDVEIESCRPILWVRRSTTS